jgi:hypothetical protein
VKTAVVTYRLELKIHVEDMMCAIPIKFHGLVLANESALVPEDCPGIGPGIVYVKV